MSSYTMRLGEYIEAFSQYETGLSLKEKIERGRSKLFDFDYPIFDPKYKAVFETNFIRKFYMREIGFETEGLFKMQLETWLDINMPYFNKLFESELLSFKPFENFDLHERHNKTNDKKGAGKADTTQKTNSTSNATGINDSTTTNTGSGTSTDDNFNREIKSDTPDTRLALTANDGQGVIQYASNIEEQNENNKNTNSNKFDGKQKDVLTNTADESGNATGNQTTSNTLNEIEDYFNDKAGKIGTQSYSSMLAEFRSTFLRIEKSIHEEMQELFMLIY